MKKRLGLIAVLVVAIALFAGCQAQEAKAAEQKTPSQVVEAYFQALKENDVEKQKELSLTVQDGENENAEEMKARLGVEESKPLMEEFFRGLTVKEEKIDGDVAAVSADLERPSVEDIRGFLPTVIQEIKDMREQGKISEDEILKTTFNRIAELMKDAKSETKEITIMLQKEGDDWKVDANSVYNQILEGIGL